MTNEQETKRVKQIFRNKNKNNNPDFKYFSEKGIDYFVNWFMALDKKCCYCEIEEYKLRELFESGRFATKRRRGKSLELERLDSSSQNNQYTEENCKLACYFCNNHKSDIINSEDHKKYFAPSIRQYLDDIYAKMKKLALFLIIVFNLKGFTQIDSTYKDQYYNARLYLNDGKIDKTTKQYYDNGQLREKIIYKDSGRVKGIYEERFFYYDNGQLQSEAFYLNNSINGINRVYYKNGQLKHESFYNNNSKRDGIDKEFYESGQLGWKIIYINGKQDGICRIYAENGKVLEEQSYKNGIAIYIKYYDKNGKVIKVLKYNK